MSNEGDSLAALVKEFAALWKNGANPGIALFLERVPEEKQSEAARLLIEVMVDDRAAETPSVRRVVSIDLERDDPTMASEVDGPDLDALGQTTTRNSTEAPATQVIGPYKLLRKLGEGGMGEVWMAEQKEPVRRRVALKLIKKGMDNQQVIARFEAEKQALAMMDHQNIAKVFDAGRTPDGQPYFVMELVQGIPLTKYCDDNKLTIDQRLKLFIDVCAGVQHAHQKGIIHRDLKPGNVLVGFQDDKPIPKVIDFGLAKAIESTQRLTDQSLFTGIGQILGTLKYMSPEQASLDNLDIDTRTDVYALGVILYELLTGSTPLDDASIKGQAALKVLEFIREKDPVKPSSKFSNSTDQEISTVTGQRKTDSGQLNRVLTRDLDWIVMKALEKDRVRRYESASGFAADIHRFLNNEPVIARPPSWGYRTRKFVRKNRAGVVAASLVTLALIAGIVGTSLGMSRARQSERDAVAAREDEATQRKEADQSRVLAESRRQEAEKNLAFARKGNNILGSMFADLDPEADYNEVSELRDAMRANLSLAIKELQGSAVGDPLEVAEMQTILGRSLAAMGDPHLAVEVFERVFETKRTLLGPDDPQTIRSMGDLGGTYHGAGRFDEAVKLLVETLARSKSAHGPDHEETLTSMSNLAMTYKELDRTDEAISLLEEALKLSSAKHGPDGLETTTFVSNLAASYYKADLFDKALPLLEKAHAIRLDKLGSDHPDTLNCLNNLAMIYQKTGDFAKALPLLKELLELRKARLGSEHPSTIRAMSNLARVFSKLDQHSEARMLYEQSLRLHKSKLGAEHPDTLDSMSNLAGIYLDLEMTQEALVLLEDAYPRVKEKLGADHSSTLSCMNNLFRGYRKSNQPEKAAPILEEALAIRKTKLGLNHPDTVATMNSLAKYYDSLGDRDKALPLFAQLLEVSKAKESPDHADTIEEMDELAKGYIAAGQLDKGFLLYEQALEATRIRYGANDNQTIDAVTRLGMSYLEAGRPDKAVLLLEQALNLKRTKGNYADESIWRSMIRLASAYLANDQADKAVPLFEQVLESRKTTLGAEHPDSVEALSGLMNACYDAGLVDRYLALLQTSMAQWRQSSPEKSQVLATHLSGASLQLLRLKQFPDAENLLRECLEIQQATQADSWITFYNQSMLGAALLGQTVLDENSAGNASRLAEAESLLVAGYDGMKQREASIPPEFAIRIPETIDRLVDYYTFVDNSDEIRKYRDLRAAYPPFAGK